MRFTSSLRVLLVGFTVCAGACAETEEPADFGDSGSFVNVGDSGAGFDAGSLGGGFDASGFPTFDGSFPTFDGGFGGTDSAVATDGAISGDAGNSDSGSSVDGGGTGGTAGGPYIRGPEPTSASASTKGSYKVMSYTSGYADGVDFGSATVWYPTDATPPFAIVAVVPGFVSGEDTTAPWGGFLASHGMAVMTIGTNTGGEQPDVRARALLQALKSLGGENTRTGSPLLGKLDISRQATIGWSMGGGGSLLAAEQTPSLKAAISLAGWNPGYNYGKVTVPALIMAVKGDGLAGGQSQGFYDTIPGSTPKLLWEVQGVGAFFAGHDNLNDPAGVTMGVAARLGLSWMKVFLEGDTRYKQFLPVKPATSTDFKTNVTL